jgi:hypothetical protein
MTNMEPTHPQETKGKRPRQGHNITTCYRCGKHTMELVDSERMYRCSACDSSLPLRCEHSVVCIVAKDFKKRGFSVKISNDFPCCESFETIKGRAQIDISCTKGDEQWVIEAKGYTKNPSDAGTDVQTGLGKLLMERGKERGDHISYGLAIPMAPHFLELCKNVSKGDREFLHLSWILVLPDNTVQIIAPGKTFENLFEEMREKDEFHST